MTEAKKKTLKVEAYSGRFSSAVEVRSCFTSPVVLLVIIFFVK